ncbi:MAG: GAF domain-containing protein, partial [Chloroflexota bacterium]|nr:GAF domain-containing protein [Chloroflexota bacterium]
MTTTLRASIYREALRSLQRVSREISATLNLEHILHLVVEEMMHVCQATRSAIAIRETTSGELQLAVCLGYSETEEAHLRAMLQTPETQPVWADVLHTNRPARTSSTTEESEITAPIFYSESLAGLILLESDRGNTFDQGILEFVEALSSQVSIAIGNDQRYDDQLKRRELLHRRADQLARVLEVSQALRSDRSLEDILEEIAYAVQESVGFNVVLISVLEGDPPHQRRMAAAGIPIAAFERMKKVQHPWTTIQKVMVGEFRISQSYYIPMEQRDDWQDRLDVYNQETDDAPRKRDGQWHPLDMLLVPLVGPGGDTQGLLSVDQPRDGHIPDQTTVEALEIFAGQAALAIENVRMVEALQYRADTLALFNEINRS